jgi:hypothetical protein
MPSVDLPRLTKRDVMRILDAHNQIMVVRQELDRAHWVGGRPCSASLMLVDLVLCELYNRAEACVKEGQTLEIVASRKGHPNLPTRIEAPSEAPYDPAGEG